MLSKREMEAVREIVASEGIENEAVVAKVAQDVEGSAGFHGTRGESARLAWIDTASYSIASFAAGYAADMP